MVHFTTIQISEETRKKLEQKKIHPRESYDAVLHRVFAFEEVPSLQEMFRYTDTLKQKRKYTTEEIIVMSHSLRGE
ncbi:TPA: hypothetical protein HA253_03765 [Candidatus Woesearchaeota archaeon]|nr:hypothetical protein [Candidatus Woesearchaeota archaeon]